MTNESAFLKQVSSPGQRGGGNRNGQRRRNGPPRPSGQRPAYKKASQPYSANPRQQRSSDDAKRGKVFTRDGYISADFTEQKKPTEKKMRSRRKKSNDSSED